VREVLLHDGGTVRLRKLHERYDPADKIGAMNYLQERGAAGEIVTGLLYAHPDSSDLHDAQQTVQAPLNALADPDLVPGAATLAAFNASLR
jgi:2-oxoglutarate ferredoxin oxidoreductase subunit beta